MNNEQKALIKAYALHDTEANGTIDGITTTTTGNLQFNIQIFIRHVEFFLKGALKVEYLCLKPIDML